MYLEKEMREFFRKLKIRIQYRVLIKSIPTMRIYDGRGKGYDVYTCSKCGEKMYTRYMDKGVTPFVILCRVCGSDAFHNDTVKYVSGGIEHNWVRPPLDWLLKQESRIVEHVLQGGLVLEDDIERLS